MPIFFFFFVLVAIVGVALAGFRYMKRLVAAWIEAAMRLGLEFEQISPGKPRMGGTIDEHRVRVDVIVKGSGKSRHTYTRYRVWYPSPDFEFRLTRQTALSRVTRFFGAQDVEVGAPGFDQSFVIKTDADSELRAFLHLGIQSTLLRTAAAYPGVVFENDRVTYEIQRLSSSADTIVSIVRRLVDAASALSGRRPRQRALVVAARARGELIQIAEKIRLETTKREKALDEELVELDTLATAGDRAAARERLDKLEATVPADPEVVGWRRRLDQPTVGRRSGSGPDAEALAEDIFSGNALSFESKAAFDDKYRGLEVRWSGSVKSVGRIPPKSEIGDEGGESLVVTVARIEHDLYGNTDIDAVVGIQPGSGFGFRRGDEVTFAGTLVRVDPLVRTVFVADARLE